MNLVKLIPAVALFFAMFVSCKKETRVKDASYTDQLIYLPAAVDGNSVNGIYQINKVAVPGQVFRYISDIANGKLNIPLAVYRSGVNANGVVTVDISGNTDTVATLLAAGKLPATTEVLPLSKYELVPQLTIADGKDFEPFILSADLDFLLNNLSKQFAIGVAASSQQKAAGRFNTAVILIDPAFLVPAAVFTTSISGRTVNFSNTSVNANQWLWDYGDGTTPSTEKAAAHTYATPGTYTVTLTAAGALGDYNKSTVTATVVIL
jgi:hypothetical protein